MFKRRGMWWARVPTRDGAAIRRSLGTGDERTAREVERMIKLLVDRREWDLLTAALGDQHSIGELFDHWRRGDDGLSEFRAQLSDVDLNTHIDKWKRWAIGRASVETVEKYAVQLRRLIPTGKPFMRSMFTRAVISAALNAIDRSSSTRRRHHAAWSSFGAYLVEIDVIDVNPMRSVKAPRSNPPRENWLRLPDVKRLVEAHVQPYRALAALREGAGAELGAALTLRRRDIDTKRRCIHLHGTKAASRDRVVTLDAWAWPHLMPALSGKTPDALLFDEERDGVTEDSARRVHRRALGACKLDPSYRMHDSRHSFAIRWMMEGINPELIAHQLGHVDATMVLRVYGKYRPTLNDLQRAQERGSAAQ